MTCQGINCDACRGATMMPMTCDVVHHSGRRCSLPVGCSTINGGGQTKLCRGGDCLARASRPATLADVVPGSSLDTLGTSRRGERGQGRRCYEVTSKAPEVANERTSKHDFRRRSSTGRSRSNYRVDEQGELGTRETGEGPGP